MFDYYAIVQIYEDGDTEIVLAEYTDAPEDLLTRFFKDLSAESDQVQDYYCQYEYEVKCFSEFPEGVRRSLLKKYFPSHYSDLLQWEDEHK
jgi:hypothetical protein